MLAQALSGVCKLNHYTLACKVGFRGGGVELGECDFSIVFVGFSYGMVLKMGCREPPIRENIG